jgi:hypothetical protein
MASLLPAGKAAKRLPVLNDDVAHLRAGESDD